MWAKCFELLTRVLEINFHYMSTGVGLFMVIFQKISLKNVTPLNKDPSYKKYKFNLLPKLYFKNQDQYTSWETKYFECKH